MACYVCLVIEYDSGKQCALPRASHLVHTSRHAIDSNGVPRHSPFRAERIRCDYHIMTASFSAEPDALAEVRHVIKRDATRSVVIRERVQARDLRSIIPPRCVLTLHLSQGR